MSDSVSTLLSPGTTRTTETGTAMRQRQRTYGPRQMETATGLARWQAERALDRGLIPPGAAGGRWTQRQVDEIRAQAGAITAVGAHPGYGAVRVAEVLDAGGRRQRTG